MPGIIYRATLTANSSNKCYIGKTTRTLEWRRKKHEGDAQKGSDLYFHRALMKYGFDAFRWEIIDRLDDKDLSIEESVARLNEMEIHYIQLFHSDEKASGFNLTKGGDGVIPNEETLAKMRASQQARFIGDREEDQRAKARYASSCYHPTPEQHEKRNKAVREFWDSPEGELAKQANIERQTGTHRSDETRQKISERKQVFLATEEGKQLIEEQAAANRGRKRSEETRAELREAWRRRKLRPTYKQTQKETAEKISASNKGRKLSEEHKQALSEARRGKALSPEHRAKLKAAWDRRRADRAAMEAHSQKLSAAQKGKHRSKEAIEKQKETMKDRPYRHTEDAKQRIGEASSAREHPSHPMPDEAREKISRAHLTPEVQEKTYRTKKENGTMNGSKMDDHIFARLREHFPDAVQHHKDPLRYPFACDFYLPTEDIFIEYDGTWTHGPGFFDEKKVAHRQLLEEWRSHGDSRYFQNAIDAWTVRDVAKRQAAETSGICRVVLKTEADLDRLIEGAHLSVGYTEDEIKNEAESMRRLKGSYAARPIHNRAVLMCQPHFYAEEQAMWASSLALRLRLVANRQRYLGKTLGELTDRELLRGFKISGLHRGYSFFSPLWIKAFIEEYRPAVVYDPFGGWGHRLLGAQGTRYIYNDIDSRSAAGASAMCRRLNLNHARFYNQDATCFTPPDDYDAVFTCPPYYDKEKYVEAPNLSYDRWLDEWWRAAVRSFLKPTVRWVGIVMTTDYAADTRRVCEEEGLTFEKEIAVGSDQIGSHLTEGKRPGETLHIFKFSGNL